jgi:hypothetical protein
MALPLFDNLITPIRIAKVSALRRIPGVAPIKHHSPARFQPERSAFASLISLSSFFTSSFTLLHFIHNIITCARADEQRQNENREGENFLISGLWNIYKATLLAVAGKESVPQRLEKEIRGHGAKKEKKERARTGPATTLHCKSERVPSRVITVPSGVIIGRTGVSGSC